MKPAIHVLTGPTAVGKTEWALRWAERNNAEIVSCDSLLFYRGMDIGTAKPSRADLARVPHHLIDICDVTERMDVARYVVAARAAVAEIQQRGRAVLVVGGSGFYLKAFFAPVADDVSVSPAIRAEVAAMPLDAALARLQALNPQGLGTLDVANPRRVSRALERCLAAGRTVLEMADAFDRQPSAFVDYELTLTRLDRTPEDLAVRIEQRVAAMLRDGLIDEVRRVRSLGFETNPSAAMAIGYREVLAFLDGTMAEAEVAGAIVRNTRMLVRKQRTWFRNQLSEHRVVDAAALASEGELFG